ncbi:hypothetical protein T265_15413, partial [Opisthorchis viverrini]
MVAGLKSVDYETRLGMLDLFPPAGSKGCLISFPLLCGSKHGIHLASSILQLLSSFCGFGRRQSINLLFRQSEVSAADPLQCLVSERKDSQKGTQQLYSEQT